MILVDDLTLGRGKIYFDQFAPGVLVGTGERFLGNCPTLQLTVNNTKLDHYSSTTATKLKDKTALVQNDMTGSFSSDNMSMANLALWFQGVLAPITNASVTPVTETHNATLGTFQQLGVDANDPMGARNISAFTLKKAAVAIAATDYEIDLVKGRVYLSPNAVGFAAGDLLTYGYTPTAQTLQVAVAKGSFLYGALRFISDNAAGTNKDYYMPYVQLTANGNLDLMSDAWQTGSFTLDILKRDSVTDRIYISQ